jgi:hypothetical protein
MDTKITRIRAWPAYLPNVMRFGAVEARAALS